MATGRANNNSNNNKPAVGELKPSNKTTISAQSMPMESPEDNESYLEKCWEEQYKGDSRKWLIRDASGRMPRGPLSSTMKDTFRYIRDNDFEARNTGRRRELLMKKFHEEAAIEVQQQRESEREILDYCTEYDGNYKIDGFQPDDRYYMKNSEALLKHPVYSSTPVSFYSFNYEQGKGSIRGLTRITSRQNIFRRNGQFSKPIAESLDYVEL